jgi:CheY-like chemotaxis protein
MLPDFIFSDINMPVMDGIECLSQIRNNPGTKHIPVVMLTTDRRKRELAHGLGATAFLKKSSAIRMLSRGLEEIINPVTIAPVPFAREMA